MYEISYREYPLRIGVIPYILYGRQVSHSFLAFSKGDDVLEEIHGMSFNRVDGVYKECETGLRYMFNFLNKSRVKLRTIELKHEPTNFDNQILLHAGADGLNKWKHCKRFARAINKADVDYFAVAFINGGINCHSVTNTIARRVFDIDLTTKTKYHTPGISNVLV